MFNAKLAAFHVPCLVSLLLSALFLLTGADFPAPPAIPSRPPRALSREETSSLQKQAAAEMIRQTTAQLGAPLASTNSPAHPRFTDGGVAVQIQNDYTLLPKNAVIFRSGRDDTLFIKNPAGNWIDSAGFLRKHGGRFTLLRADRVNNEYFISREQIQTAKASGKTVIVIHEGEPVARFSLRKE
ncbi:MAG: hypothetical protein PHV34_15600 [Verrucomicrobiae bacterium]|nr:hypothetical protein [Verrucomicrobiae bacterium]